MTCLSLLGDCGGGGVRAAVGGELTSARNHERVSLGMPAFGEVAAQTLTPRQTARSQNPRSSLVQRIVTQHAKQSDMHWTVNGAADITALGCQHASGRWDELWARQPPVIARPPRLRAAI